MQSISIKFAALAIAAPALAFATPTLAAAPTQPAPASTMTSSYAQAPIYADVTVEHKRKKRGHYHDRRDYRDNRNYRGNRGRVNYGDPIGRNTRIWRGNDGRYYCRKDNGTTGLLIGAAVGGLIGNEVAGRGDRTLGAILGAAGGAILGRSIDRSNSRCR